MQAKKEMEAIKALNEKIAGIVESGSNDNGSWVKFADGTMIQWGSKNFVGASNSTGSYTRVIFPQVFANNKYSTSYSSIYTGNVAQTISLYVILIGSNTYGSGTNLGGDTVYRRLAYTTDATELAELYATNLSFNWHAIGFWK